jgi:hypothetical protein
MSAPGALATFTSRTTLPALSSTQTLEVSSETSIPAYWSMVIPPLFGAGSP